MRFIDADKLLEDINGSNLEFFMNGKIVKYLKETIDEQSTILEKDSNSKCKVTYGDIDSLEVFICKCDKCNSKWGMTCDDILDDLKYCPVCGSPISDKIEKE